MGRRYMPLPPPHGEAWCSDRHHWQVGRRRSRWLLTVVAHTVRVDGSAWLGGVDPILKVVGEIAIRRHGEVVVVGGRSDPVTVVRAAVGNFS